MAQAYVSRTSTATTSRTQGDPGGAHRDPGPQVGAGAVELQADVTPGLGRPAADTGFIRT